MHSQKLRIALFSGNYNYVKDGANQALNRLVGYLLRQGVEVRIYSPTTDTPAFAPTGDLVSVPSFPFPMRGEYRVGWKLTPALIADIDAFAPDIIHLSSPDILGHSALSYAEARGIPAVSSVHTRFDTYFQYYRMGWLTRWIENTMRRFYQRCTEIYAPSASMVDVLRAQNMSDAIHVWSRGVDHEIFHPARRDMAWRRSLGIADDRFLIAFVGRLVLEKGLDILAQTAEHLRRRGVAHQFLIVGDGPARAFIETHVPDAVLAGFMKGADLARAYASADAMFNPSSTETFGNVTLEAMACGLPVVAAAATGSLSLVEEGRSGYFAPINDAQASAEALARYAQDRALAQAHGIHGHHLSQNYEWDAINQTVLDRYLAILRAKEARRAA